MSVADITSAIGDDAETHLRRAEQLCRQKQLGAAEAAIRRAIELSPRNAAARNSLGWVLHLQGDHDGAVAAYRIALDLDPDLQSARRNLAVLLVRLGRRHDSTVYWQRELSTRSGLVWLNQLAETAMKSRDLTLAGEYAAILAEFKWASRWYPQRGIGPAAAPPQALTVPKLRHDIEQFAYLQQRGVLGAEFTDIIARYERTIARLEARDAIGQVPLDEDARREIGDVYNRIVHIRDTTRLPKVFSDAWEPAVVEQQYLDTPPGVIVVDDFLTDEALHSLRAFCLESTVWSGNRYAHGRLGAFFRDGFNCPLLLQIAEQLRTVFPRVIGDRYPLRQLWGFKNGQTLPADSTTHADFAAINVNFWITPDSANLDPASGGMVVYGVDAPAHWDFQTYNNRPDIIKPYLQQQQARAVTIPYRQNRAIIFNSDLFHATSGLQFRPGYENRRINVTMLYGDREQDIHHRDLARPVAVPQQAQGWRSAAFGRGRR